MAVSSTVVEEAFKVDISGMPGLFDMPLVFSLERFPRAAPKNIDDFIFDYEVTRDNIKIALDNARLLREHINNYTNEHILESKSFSISNVDYGTVPVNLNLSNDPHKQPTGSRGYKIELFQKDVGLVSQLKESLDRYKHVDSGPSFIKKFVDGYPSPMDDSQSEWNKIGDINTIFTLMAYHNAKISADLKKVDSIFQTIDGLNFNRIPDNITDYYIKAIIEKVQGRNTNRMSNTIRELDKIIDSLDGMRTAEGFLNRVTSLLFNIFDAASNILDGNKKTLYAFLLDEYGASKTMFERLFIDDEIGGGDVTAINERILSDYSSKLGGTSIVAGEEFKDLRKEAKKQNVMIHDRGAYDEHRTWTDWLNTRKIDKAQYKDTIKSVSENFASFKTKEERYLIAVAMKIIFTSHGENYMGYENRESQSYDETTLHALESEHGLFSKIVNTPEADNGVGDTATETIRIELTLNESLSTNFKDVYLRGVTQADGSLDVNNMYGSDDPVTGLVNKALKYFIPYYLHLRELNLIGQRVAMVKEMLESADEVDAEAINRSFEGDYSGILRNGDINIGLAVKQYYDLLQEETNPLIQNRFMPPSDIERIAIDTLFSETHLLEGFIGEQKKIFSIGLTRESIGDDLAPKSIYVTITKKDKFYPNIEFEPYKIEIDILNFPVINGYSFHSTKIGSRTNLDTGSISADSTFDSFKDFVRNGMHFLNFDEITEGASENTIQPETFDELLSGLSASGQQKKSKKLISAAKSFVLGIYLRALFGTEFKGLDLDDRFDDIWYDADAEDKYNKIYADSSSTSEMSQRFKDIMLYTSTIFNKTKITNDVLYLHDIMYTYHLMLDIDVDFPQIGDETYNPSKVLENIEFEIKSYFFSDIQNTIEEDIEEGDIL
jgi:hypothetical protein